MIFYLIFLDFISYFKSQKGVPYRKTVKLMWHVKLTWRVGPARMGHDTQGHVEEPHEPTHGLGGADTWQSPHESTQTPGWRHVVEWGWQMKGPRVSGPWIVYWGCFARALFRPTLYTRQLPQFPLCGTMFHIMI